MLQYTSAGQKVKHVACVARLSEEDCSHRSSVPAGLQAKRAQKERLTGTQVSDFLHTMLHVWGKVSSHLAENLL